MAKISSSRIYNLLYDKLIEYNYETGIYDKVLVEDYTVEDDGVRFVLKKGIGWHDDKEGTQEVSSHDIVWMIKNILLSPDRPQSEYYRERFSEAFILSEYEFKIVFHESVQNKNDYLKSCTFYVLKTDNEDEIVGTGPYRYNKNKSDISNLILEAWSNYRLGEPNISQIIVERKSTNNSLKLDFDKILFNGNVISIIPETPHDLTALFSEYPYVQSTEYLDHSFQGIVFNSSGNSFGDVKLRKAINMVIDKESINKKVYKSEGELLSGPFNSRSSYYGNSLRYVKPDIDTLSYYGNYARSQSRSSVDILIRENDEDDSMKYRDIAEEIRIQLVDLGYEEDKVTITAKKEDEYISSLDKGDFDIAIIRWAFEPSYDIRSLFHSQGGNNYSGVSDLVLDGLLEEYSKSVDEEQTNILVSEIVSRLNVVVPYVFLFSVDYQTTINFTLFGVDLESNDIFKNISEWYVRNPPFGL